MTLTLNNVSDGTNVGNVAVPVSFLLGDVNGSGSVGSTDVAVVKSNSGVPVSAGNFRSDVNTSGVINATDLSIAKASSGHALP
jgi:hypothetical protein